MDDLANERANNKIFLNIQETGHGQYMIVMFYLNMNNLNKPLVKTYNISCYKI